MIGNRFKSNNYGWFTVVEDINEISRHKRYTIEFDEIRRIKYKCIATKDNILNGRVKNPYYPSICGVACLGDTNLDGKLLEYRRWKMMINRCYNKENQDYNTYGALGVTVCDRWLCFENYYEDFSRIEGYDKDNINNLVLDKDIKSNNYKVYSLDTCMFVPVSINAKEVSKRTKQKEFIAISPKGEIFESDNQREFAIANGLDIQNVNGVLKGRNKTHKGWKFYYKGE